MIVLAIQLTQEQRCCLLICGQPAKLTERLKVEPFPDEESLPLYMSPILVLHTPALAAQGPSTGCRQRLSVFLCLSAMWHFRRNMVDCTRAIFSQSVRPAAAYFAISLLRPSGEKKQTFSVVSLQLTVQLPCLNVFSSFILPLRACQRRSFDDVSTVDAEAERGVNTRQPDRSPQSLRSTKIRAWLPSPWPDQRRLVVCCPRSWSELSELVEVWSSPYGVFAT